MCSEYIVKKIPSFYEYEVCFQKDFMTFLKPALFADICQEIDHAIFFVVINITKLFERLLTLII